MMPDVDYTRIGQRIKRRRTELGLTQAELSSLVNCSNNHLSHIEVAQCKVSLGMLLKLSQALSVGIDYFLLDTPYAKPEQIIQGDISEKLARCNSATLVTVSKMLDSLLELQDMLLQEE